MWLLAIGVAGLGTSALVALGLLDPTQSIYHLAQFSPLAAILGGLMFGYGMALAGNCGFGALARFGGGDLRSFVIVLVMGISAYVILSGPLAHVRLMLLTATDVDISQRSYPELASTFTGVGHTLFSIVMFLVLTLFALSSAAFRRQPKAMFWGTAVGVAIVSGWAGTSYVAMHGFSTYPVNSHVHISAGRNIAVFDDL